MYHCDDNRTVESREIPTMACCICREKPERIRCLILDAMLPSAKHFKHEPFNCTSQFKIHQPRPLPIAHPNALAQILWILWMLLTFNKFNISSKYLHKRFQYQFIRSTEIIRFIQNYLRRVPFLCRLPSFGCLIFAQSSLFPMLSLNHHILNRPIYTPFDCNFTFFFTPHFVPTFFWWQTIILSQFYIANHNKVLCAPNQSHLSWVGVFLRLFIFVCVMLIFYGL